MPKIGSVPSTEFAPVQASPAGKQSRNSPEIGFAFTSPNRAGYRQIQTRRRPPKLASFRLQSSFRFRQALRGSSPDLPGNWLLTKIDGGAVPLDRSRRRGALWAPRGTPSSRQKRDQGVGPRGYPRPGGLPHGGELASFRLQSSLRFRLALRGGGPDFPGNWLRFCQGYHAEHVAGIAVR